MKYLGRSVEEEDLGHDARSMFATSSYGADAEVSWGVTNIIAVCVNNGIY